MEGEEEGKSPLMQIPGSAPEESIEARKEMYES